jgi:hypothetical protein
VKEVREAATPLLSNLLDHPLRVWRINRWVLNAGHA